jgi:hypothetical protein
MHMPEATGIRFYCANCGAFHRLSPIQQIGALCIWDSHCRKCESELQVIEWVDFEKEDAELRKNWDRMVSDA